MKVKLKNISCDFGAFAVGLCLYAVVFAPSNAMAQQGGTIRNTDVRPFAMSGSLSLISEGYAVSGIEARRPPGLGQVHLNTSFSIFGIQSGLNLLYSTDDNKLRQSTNQVSFGASWKWLKVSAGMVSPGMSKFSLNGVSVAGGHIEMNPGWFSLTVVGGKSKRAVNVSDNAAYRQAAYEQWLYATRIGFGKKEGTQFSIIGLYAYDVASSLQGPGELLPSKSFNITPGLQLSLFKNTFKLNGNATVALFTRNVESTKIQIQELENVDVVNDYLEPRSSSCMDYAAEITIRMNLDPVKIDGSYERIQPGFHSSGLGHIRSDHEQYRIRTQMRLFKRQGNFSGMYSRGRNNLLQTRISTLRRQQLTSALSFRIAQNINLNASYMFMLNENNPTDLGHTSANELHSSLQTQHFMLTPSVVLQKNQINHTVALTASYQILQDDSKMVLAGNRPASDFESFTSGLTYTITLPSSLSMGFSGNLMQNNTSSSNVMGNSINISGGYAFMEKKLSTNLSMGWSRNGIDLKRVITDPDQTPQGLPTHFYKPSAVSDEIMDGDYVVERWSTQFSANMSLSYRFKKGNALNFSIRGLLSRPDALEGGQRYDEVHAVLRYQQRF